MKNKTVHRTKLKAGTYTMAPYHITRDSRLTSNAKILLIEILSDADDFRLSQSLYCKRLSWDKKQFDRAIQCLIKAGYVKRTPIDEKVSIPGVKKAGSKKVLYHYTISEYGNLNSDEVEIVGATPTVEELNEFTTDIESNEFKYYAVENLHDDRFNEFQYNSQLFNELKHHITTEAKNLQVEYIKHVKSNLKGYNTDKYPSSMKTKMDERIKQVVFTEKRQFKPSEHGGRDEAQQFWGQLISKHERETYHLRVDLETRMTDEQHGS